MVPQQHHTCITWTTEGRAIARQFVTVRGESVLLARLAIRMPSKQCNLGAARLVVPQLRSTSITWTMAVRSIAHQILVLRGEVMYSWQGYLACACRACGQGVQG